MGGKRGRIFLIAPTLAQKRLGISVWTITDPLANFQAPAKPWRRSRTTGDEKKALPKSNTDSAKTDVFDNIPVPFSDYRAQAYLPLMSIASAARPDQTNVRVAIRQRAAHQTIGFFIQVASQVNRQTLCTFCFQTCARAIGEELSPKGRSGITLGLRRLGSPHCFHA